MNFVDYLFETSKLADKDFILSGKERLSYKDAWRKICSLAQYLRESVGENKNVVLLSKNSAFFVISYLGIMKSGNVCVPLSPSIGEARLEYIMKSLGSPLCLVQQESRSKLERFCARLMSEQDMPAAQAATSDSEFDQDRIAEIIFTSGSTALPKGVVLSHQNLIANTSSILEYLKLTQDDTILAVLPFSYCYGLSLLHTHARVGGSVVLNNTFMMLRTVISDIQEYRCTGFSGVPTHFQILLRQSDLLKKAEIPSLRYVTQAGGKLAKVLIKEFAESFPKIRFYVMYGMTEATARLSYLEPDLVLGKLGSIGHGIPGVTLQVLDADGKPVKPGEPGEIVATGKNVMLGYFNDPESSAKMLRMGRLYTGDLATVDEDGFIFFLAREADFLKISGVRVSPKEIEETLLASIPEIVDCSLATVPHPVLGDVLKAFVVVKEGSAITAEAIQSACRNKLSPEMVPRYIDFLPQVPMNESGKKVKGDITKLSGQPGS